MIKKTLFITSPVTPVHLVTLEKQETNLQHEYDIKTQKKKNGMGDHMSKNKKYTINWNSRTFLEVEKNWKLRRIKESLYINSLNPSNEIDASKLMNPEKGMEIADCWKEFHLMVRAILKKATPKKSTKTSEKSKPEESQRAIKRKMTHVICYISQPLCLKYLYLHCFEFLVAKRKDYCR